MNEKLLDILKPTSDCISEETLFSYAKGKLSADEVRRVEEHLADCQFCSEALDGLMEGDLAQSEKAVNEINEEIRRKTSSRKVIPVRRLISIAAAVLVIAVSAWFVNTLLQKPAEKIFTDQFKPYPPQQENVIATEPPAVNEVKAPEKSDHLEKKEEKPRSTNTAAENKQVTSADESVSKAAPMQEGESQSAPLPAVQSLDLATKDVQSAEYSANDTVISDVAKSVRSQSEVAQSNFNAAEKNTEVVAAQPANKSAAVEHNAILEDFNLGMKAYREQNYADAITLFQLVLNLEPNNPAANFYSGVSSLAINKPDDALSFFKRTDNKSNQFYEATLWYEALSYISKGDKKQAKALLEKVSNLNGEYKSKADETLKEL